MPSLVGAANPTAFTGAMGQVLKVLTSLGDPNSTCLSIYGHQVSDLAVFIANVFMLGYEHQLM